MGNGRGVYGTGRIGWGGEEMGKMGHSSGRSSGRKEREGVN